MTYPILYNPGHTDFNNLGLGLMVDTISATVTEELNGKFELDLEYLADGPLTTSLINDAFIKVPTGDQVDQLFRIKSVGKKLKGILPIHAEHVSYIINDLPIKPRISVINADGAMALNAALINVIDKHPLTAYSDVMTTADLEWKLPDFQNIRNILGGVEGSILDRIGGEYQFDNYQIRLMKQRGRYSNTIIAYGRNLTDFEQDESILETYTSIYPVVIETEDDTQKIKVLPEYVIDGDYVDKYPNRRVTMVDFSEKFNENNTYSEAKLRKLAQTYVKANNVGVPKVTMKVSTVDLSAALDDSFNVKEVESLHLGDTVKVFFEPLGITSEAKVVGVAWNVLLERYDSYTLGAKKASFGQWVNNSVNDIKNIANSAQHSAIQAVTSANGKNTNYYGNSGDGFPKNPKKGDLYFQKDGDKMTIYQWDGSSWINVIDTSWQEDFEKELQDKLNQAKKELDDAIAANNESLVDLDTALTENTKELSNVKDTLVQNQKDLDNLSELTDNATQAGLQAQAAADAAKKESASATEAANNARDQALQAIESAGFANAQSQTAIDMANGLQSTVVHMQTDLDGKATITQLSDFQQTVNGFQMTVTDDIKGIQSQQTQMAGQITSIVADVAGAQSSITQLSNSINLAVMKNDVINQINVSTEGVVIAGSRVTITGQTYIENGVIGNAQIADAAIDSAKIRNITADKLVIGQGGNVVANPDFFKDTVNVEPVGWVGGVVKSNALPSPVNPNGKYIRVDSSATANKHAMSQDYIKVVPGEQYSVKAVYFSRYSSVQVGFRGYNEKQEVATSSWIHVQGSATGSSWKQLEGTVTIPEGVQYVRIRVTSLSNATVDFSGFASIDIRRKQDYSLIVDGAILARHLAVDSVTANAIASNSITAVKIASNAITAEKILAGAVTTQHLAAGSITATQLAAGAVNMGSATVTGTLDASRIRVINLDASELKAGTIDAAQVRIINLDVDNLTGNLTNFVKTQWNAGFGDQVAITSNAITMNTSNANLSLTANALRFYSSSYAGASAVFSLGKWRDSSGTQTASTGIYFGSSPSVKSNTNFTNFLNTNGASYMLYAESTMNYGSNTNIVKNALNIFSTTHIWGPTTIHAAAAIYGYLTFYGGDFSRITVDPNKATMNFRIKSGVAHGSYFWFNSKIISADGWASSSLLSMKDVKKEYDGDALGEICKTQLVEYSYKNSPHDKQLSPIIDDVNAVKQYYIPEIITDGKTVNNYAMQSLAWAAIKQLNEKIEELEKKIA